MAGMGLQKTLVLFCVASVIWTISECADQKSGTASTSSQTDPTDRIMDAYQFVLDMPITSILRTGALVLLFLAILVWDRRIDTWIKATICLAGLGGMGHYFSPASTGNLASEKDAITPAHEYFVQLIGAFMIAQCYCGYRLSNDATTRFLILLSQAMGSATLFIIHFYGHTKYGHMKPVKDDVYFNCEHVTNGLMVVGLMFVGAVIFLYKQSNQDGGYRAEVILKGGLNTHLIIDGFILTLMGVQNLAFPEIALSQMNNVTADGVMATFARHIGAIDVITGICSILACSLTNENDKRVLLFNRILVYGLCFPLITLYQLKFHYVSWTFYIVAMLVHLIPVANSVCALYIRGGKKKWL